jgi:hypothetical protein
MASTSMESASNTLSPYALASNQRADARSAELPIWADWLCHASSVVADCEPVILRSGRASRVMYWVTFAVLAAVAVAMSVLWISVGLILGVLIVSPLMAAMVVAPFRLARLAVVLRPESATIRNLLTSETIPRGMVTDVVIVDLKRSFGASKTLAFQLRSGEPLRIEALARFCLSDSQREFADVLQVLRGWLHVSQTV